MTKLKRLSLSPVPQTPSAKQRKDAEKAGFWSVKKLTFDVTPQKPAIQSSSSKISNDSVGHMKEWSFSKLVRLLPYLMLFLSIVMAAVPVLLKNNKSLSMPAEGTVPPAVTQALKKDFKIDTVSATETVSEPVEEKQEAEDAEEAEAYSDAEEEWEEWEEE